MSKQINLDKIKKWIPKLTNNVSLDSVDNKHYLVRFNNHKISNMLRKFRFKIPMETKLELDEYSYFVICLINGENSIDDIALQIKNRYGEEANPIYERLLMFLEILEKRYKVIKFK